MMQKSLKLNIQQAAV